MSSVMCVVNSRLCLTKKVAPKPCRKLFTETIAAELPSTIQCGSFPETQAVIMTKGTLTATSDILLCKLEVDFCCMSKLAPKVGP